MEGVVRMSARTDGFWARRRVFVTGCTGLLGSWLSDRLVEEGADVVGLVRDSVPHSNFHRLRLPERMSLVQGDLVDYAVLERTLAEYEIEAVFHIAAQTIVPIANRTPLSTFESNIKGTWNLLEAARRHPLLGRFVFSSSDKSYGTHERLPYDETAELRACHPYDVSKACGDMLAVTYHRTWGLPVGISRCANLFGGGDLNFNRIVPGTIRSALHGERPVIRSDGTLVRDYFFVKDAVDGLLALAQALDRAEVRGEAFNFSSHHRRSVLEITAETLGAVGRADLEPIVLDEATAEIPAQYLSSDKARRVLGWTPHHTLADGLVETVEWYRGYFDGRAPRGAAPARAPGRSSERTPAGS